MTDGWRLQRAQARARCFVCTTMFIAMRRRRILALLRRLMWRFRPPWHLIRGSRMNRGARPLASLNVIFPSLASIVVTIDDPGMTLGLYTSTYSDDFIPRRSLALVVGTRDALIACGNVDELCPLRWLTVDLTHKSGAWSTSCSAVWLRVFGIIVNNRLKFCDIYCSVEMDPKVLEWLLPMLLEGRTIIHRLLSQSHRSEMPRKTEIFCTREFLPALIARILTHGINYTY